MKLIEPFRRHYKGYRLNLAYDRVLQLFVAMDDKLLSGADKADVAVRLLVKWPRPFLSASRIKLWNEVYQSYIKPKPIKGKIGPRSFDFEQDAEYIYAAFRQSYGVDLMAERGRLDWRAFLAMFQALPGDTRLAEIMGIRTREIPAPTQYNQAEVDALREAKRAFALDIKDNVGASSFKEGLADLFNTLKAQALKKGG